MRIEKVELNGNQVGEVYDSLVYVSHRKESKHMFRGGKKTTNDAKKLGVASWGIDMALFPILKDMGVVIVAINDLESKIVYYTTLKLFEDKGRVLQLGHGLQKFLTLGHFRVANSIIALVGAVREVVV